MSRTPADEEIELRLLLEAIYIKYKYDFRHYTRASLKRRIEALLTELKLETISALQEKIIHEPAIFPRVLKYLTIPTTEMFRDPAYFKAFREKVVPVLQTYPSLRLWVAGCSTGEEVYSYAILLEEEGLWRKTLLYATDINHDSLVKAEAGIFRSDEMGEFARNYQRAGGKASLADYFTVRYSGALIQKSFAKNIVFSDHSLATDHVFSEVHFVSCRNVLIYFDRELQDRAIGLFKDSLVHRGILGIGSKESLRFSAHGDAFEPWVGEQKIFRKKG